MPLDRVAPELEASALKSVFHSTFGNSISPNVVFTPGDCGFVAMGEKVGTADFLDCEVGMCNSRRG